jgi:hypothetical protein
MLPGVILRLRSQSRFAQDDRLLDATYYCVDGAPGTEGTDGAPGTEGTDGAPGTEGTDGALGIEGIDAPGIEGIDDAPGIEGIDGTPAGDAIADGDAIIEDPMFCIIWPAAFCPACFAAPIPAEPIPPSAPCACARRGMHAKISATVSPAKVCAFMIIPSGVWSYDSEA